MMIEFAIHDPPALPTSPVFVSTATIENVDKANELKINTNIKYLIFINNMWQIMAVFAKAAILTCVVAVNYYNFMVTNFTIFLF